MSCVRLKHIETGFIEQSTKHREASKNLKEAFSKLVKRLIDHYNTNNIREKYPISDEIVRTYHMVDNCVKDHRTNIEMSYDDFVKNDGLDKMILEHMADYHENND